MRAALRRLPRTAVRADSAQPGFALDQFINKLFSEEQQRVPRREYRSLPVDGALAIKSKVAYNPEFINNLAELNGRIADYDDLSAVQPDLVLFAPLLDLTYLRVHRKYNQNLRRTGQALLLGLSTSVSRITKRVKPFLYDSEYYVHNPHPYDAEGYLPAKFIQGCQHVMEHLLNKIWGDDVYNGLTSEREMLTKMFVRVLDSKGLDPRDVNRAYDLMEIREQLELYLLNSGSKSIDYCLMVMMNENPQWMYSKDLADCIEQWTLEGIPKEEYEDNVRNFLNVLQEEILSSRLVDELEQTGEDLLKFSLLPNAKQEYEAALFEHVLNARKSQASLEGVEGIPTKAGLRKDLSAAGGIDISKELSLEDRMFNVFPAKAPPKDE
jgi:hypothetical protein